jgi:hypothetical protein
MNKKLMMALLGATIIATGSYAGEEPPKSFGQKAAEAVKAAVYFVGNVVKGTANFPNTVAHSLGYFKETKTLKQVAISAAFWFAVFCAVKKTYETYKEKQMKKKMEKLIEEISQKMQNKEGANETMQR